MNKISIASLFLVVLPLTALAETWQVPRCKKYEVIKNRTTIERDDFKKLVRFSGPACVPKSLPVYTETPMVDSDYLFIRAWKRDGSAVVTYQIYVVDYYKGDWRFYESAWDSNGNKLDTTLIARDATLCDGFGGCLYTEEIGINVTGKYLKKNEDSGIRFKLSGNAGEEIFFLPSEYIKAFLDRIGAE